MEEMGCKKFYLLGTDYVFPRTADKVLKAFLKSKGVPDENVMEEYFNHATLRNDFLLRIFPLFYFYEV